MPTPDIDTVRLLADVSVGDLSDTQIADLLGLHGGAVKAAAAEALDILAARLQSVTSDDITLDGSKRAAVLLQRAAQLRAQHDADTAAEAFVFEVVDASWPRPELTEPDISGWY